MLEKNYQDILERLVASVSWDIELPGGTEAFFRDSGMSASCEMDERSAARMRARAYGILSSEKALPAFPRDPEPIGIYTTDFSKTGIGFIAAEEFLPEETVRITLPTFWTHVRISRCNKLGPNCFQVGGVLISRHAPSPRAFAE